MCSVAGWYSAGIKQCPPGGLINLRGQNFVRDVQTRVVITAPSGASVNCSSPTFQTPNLLQCTLPTLTGELVAQFYAQNVAVQMLFPSSGSSTNSLGGQLLMAYPDQALISSITGCTSTGMGSALLGPVLLASGCRSQAVLTIQGRNLNGSAYRLGSVGLTAMDCTLLPGATSTAAQCQLPYFDADSYFVVGQVYAYALLTTAPIWRTSQRGAAELHPGSPGARTRPCALRVLVLLRPDSGAGRRAGSGGLRGAAGRGCVGVKRLRMSKPPSLSSASAGRRGGEAGLWGRQGATSDDYKADVEMD